VVKNNEPEAAKRVRLYLAEYLEQSWTAAIPGMVMKVE
jgi:hypothetical protein